MDPFNEFVKTIKTSLESDLNNDNIHIVMGNESCDLDSMISSLALGYLWYQKDEPNTIVIPVLNIPASELCFRTENCYVLRKLGIDPNSLVCRDCLNLKELQAAKVLQISLVDYHVLSESDNFLSASVIEIFDHRPVDEKAAWDKDKVKIRIEQVGSCATIVAEELLNYKNDILSNNLISLLQYTMIFDTIAFNPEAGRTKELDVQVYKRLSEKSLLRGDTKVIFDELWTAHNDVSHLTPKQLLSKDLKIVEGLPIPGLPMLVKNYLQLPNALQDMRAFCEEKCVSTMVIIGLHCVENEGVNHVYRDVALFHCNDDDINLVNVIISNLKDALKLKGFDFEFEEVSLDIKGVKYFKQNNVKLTRKHILPLVKDAVIEYKSNKI